MDLPLTEQAKLTVQDNSRPEGPRNLFGPKRKPPVLLSVGYVCTYS